MANNEFKSIKDFIEGFTRVGPTPETYTYDGVIWGIEFQYRNRIFRITRDTVGNEKALQKRFNKTSKAFIQFFEIPKEEYPNASDIPFENYYGIYDDVDDLLNNGKVEGIALRNIIASDQTEILGID